MKKAHRIGLAVPSRLAVLALLSGALALPVQADPATVVVEVHGLRSSNGVVRGALYASADGWTEHGREVGSCRARIVRDHALCTIHNASAGRYAVAILHDENDSGDIDRNFLGIPEEGFGFSNDARAGLGGPPSFDDSAFDHTGGETRIRIHARYGI